MKSLFNKARSFPQYFDTIDALRRIVDAEKVIIDGTFSIFSANLDSDLEDQSTDTKNDVAEIISSGQRQAETMHNMLYTAEILPNSLSSLQANYAEIIREKEAVSSAREAASKSKRSLNKAKMKYDRFKGHATNSAFKAEQMKAIAKKQAEDDDANAENTRDQKFRRITELKSTFLKELAKALKEDAEVKGSKAKVLLKFADEMENIATNFHEFHDPLSSTLHDRLNQLESEVIE